MVHYNFAQPCHFSLGLIILYRIYWICAAWVLKIKMVPHYGTIIQG